MAEVQSSRPSLPVTWLMPFPMADGGRRGWGRVAGVLVPNAAVLPVPGRSCRPRCLVGFPS